MKKELLELNGEDALQTKRFYLSRIVIALSVVITVYTANCSECYLVFYKCVYVMTLHAKNQPL